MTAMQLIDKYTRGMLVVEHMRSGDTLTNACKKVGVSRHVVATLAKNDERFREVLEDADREGQDTLAEILVDIDQYHPDPKMAAVVSKNIQWLLSKRRVADYGDRITVDTNKSQDEAILSALNEAIKRIPMPEQTPPPVILDAEPAPCGTSPAPPPLLGHHTAE
jgi:hypothetical protein